MGDSISITPDLMVKRAWNVAATAAATNSITTATKAAAAASAFVMTGLQAGYSGASSATPNAITVKVNGTAVRYYVLPAGSALNLQWDEDDWVVGGLNQSVSAELAASAVSASVGYISICGFHVGAR